MAEAYGKLTGRPGICFVTRGPGATQRERRRAHGLPGLDADDPPRRPGRARVTRPRGVPGGRLPQAMFAPLAKWVAQIDDAERIPELVGARVPVATSGRPARSCSRCPRTCSRRRRRVADATPCARRRSPPRAPSSSTRLRAAARARRAAARDRRRRRLDARRRRDDMRALLPRRTRCRSPPRSAARTTSTTGSPCYAGDLGIGINPKLAERVREADLLLVVGARLGEMTTGGYTLRRARRARGRRSCTCTPDAEELGRVYHAELADRRRHAGVRGGAARARRRRASRWDGLDRGGARRLRREPRRPARARRRSTSARSSPSLRDAAARDAIVTNGAGNFSVWVHRFWRFTRYRTQLAPTSGAMGYGAAGRGRGEAASTPSATVVCFAGDGGFLMSAARSSRRRCSTASPIVVLVVEQRHVRHDPHASGAPLSGPRRRHRPRRIRTSPRSRAPSAPRRDGRAHRGVRARARARASRRAACAARAARRSRGDPPAEDDSRDPRRAGAEASVPDKEDEWRRRTGRPSSTGPWTRSGRPSATSTDWGRGTPRWFPPARSRAASR